MSTDVSDFIVSNAEEKEYLIDQLIRCDSGYALVVGKTGLGKTNLALTMADCLARGTPFFGLKTKQAKVLYLAFEGGEENLRDRLTKIILRQAGFPDPDYFHIERVNSFVLTDRRVEAKFRDMLRPFDVVVIDPIKWFVGRDYTRPERASEFTKKLTEVLREEDKIAILTSQVRKRDNRTKIEPGDVFEAKGAADYAEDAACILLLEKMELRGKHVPAAQRDRYLTLYFAKHREAVRDLAPIDLFYEYDACEFTTV